MKTERWTRIEDFCEAFELMTFTEVMAALDLSVAATGQHVSKTAIQPVGKLHGIPVFSRARAEAAADAIKFFSGVSVRGGRIAAALRMADAAIEGDHIWGWRDAAWARGVRAHEDRMRGLIAELSKIHSTKRLPIIKQKADEERTRKAAAKIQLIRDQAAADAAAEALGEGDVLSATELALQALKQDALDALGALGDATNMSAAAVAAELSKINEMKEVVA